MALTAAEQARLGEIYAPVVFLAADDVPPINPREYIRRSALWSNSSPDLPGKEFWGQPRAGADDPLQDRVPELRPGEILASDGGAGLPGQTVLWSHLAANSSTHHFLDHDGWGRGFFDEVLGQSVDPMPTAGWVAPGSYHGIGSTRSALLRWRPVSAHPELEPHIGWYSVEAFDLTEDSDAVLDRLLESWHPAARYLPNVVRSLPRPIWLVYFHLFFPARPATVSRCEFIAQMNALHLQFGPDLAPLQQIFEGWWNEVRLSYIFRDEPTEIFSSPTLPASVTGPLPGIDDLQKAGIPLALLSSGRLGQFVTVGLAVQAPSGFASSSPLVIPDAAFSPPIFAGFGQSSTRIGMDGVPIEVPLMPVFPTTDLTLTGNHPHVHVSAGQHNAYPKPGIYPRADAPHGSSVCESAGVGQGDEPPFNEITKQRALLRIGYTKLLTTGLFVGAVWTMAEFIRDRRRGADADLDDLLEDPLDAAEIDPDGLVLAPADLITDLADLGPAVRPWAGSGEARVADPRWTNPRLRWGPPALRDPFGLRRGQPMPEYLGTFLESLARHLEATR
jgi:hypothetical protein